MARVVTERRTYTELVYFDDAGREMGRETRYDDDAYDVVGERELTGEEREEWGLDD
jgi:hypothetical protein